MTTPRSVTETVPDSIKAREPVTIAHLIQRERVRASILAVPDVRGSHETIDTPQQDYPRA